MTDAQRWQAIQDLIRKRTEEITVDKATARAALIKEGIYTKKGALRAEFGGGSKKAKAVA